MGQTGGTIIKQLRKTATHSEVDFTKTQLNTEWRRLGSWEPEKAPRHQDGPRGKNPEASVLEDAGLRAQSKVSVGAWVHHSEG